MCDDCRMSASDSNALCYGSSVNGEANVSGGANVYDDNGACTVYSQGFARCNEK